MKARTHGRKGDRCGSLWPKLWMKFTERWAGAGVYVLTDRVTFALIDFVTATQMVNKGLGVELGVISVLHCQEL